MATKNDRIVYRRPDGTWVNQRIEAQRASSRHDTQRDAVGQAKAQVERDGGELTIKGRDRRIRSKDSYGKDPNPPKDTEH